MVITLTLLACVGSDTGGPAVPTDTAQDSPTVPDSDTEATDTEDTEDTAPAVDQDGDGYNVDQDCDDINPYVHPGADELCDALDQDCDGESLAPGVCANAGYLSGAFVAVARIADFDWWCGARIVDDLTGDGHADLLAGPCPESEGGGNVDAVFDGAVVPASPAYFPTDAAIVLADPAGYTDSYARLSPGDLDGDGAPDAAFFDTCCGEIYVFSGPLAQDHRIEFAEADYVWPLGTADWYGEPVVELGDLDGDGRADLGFLNEWEADPIGHARLDIVFGAAEAVAGVATVREGTTAGTFVPVGDVTGDGADDLLYWGLQTAILDGSPIRSGETIEVDDVVAFGWDRGEPTSNRIDGSNAGATTDWDGDGYREVYVAQDNARATEGVGAIYFFQAPFEAIASYSDATGTIGADVGEHFAEAVWQTNDAETGEVLALTALLEYGVTTIRAILPVGVVSLSEVDHVDFDRGAALLVGYGGGYGRDIDGDGITDLAGNDRDVGIIGYIPGFIPPWDDPTYW